jgi:hypothetical protein
VGVGTSFSRAFENEFRSSDFRFPKWPPECPKWNARD